METNRIEYKRELTPDLDIEKEVIALLNYGEDCFKFTDNFIRITFPASVQVDLANPNHKSN